MVPPFPPCIPRLALSTTASYSSSLALSFLTQSLFVLCAAHNIVVCPFLSYFPLLVNSCGTTSQGVQKTVDSNRRRCWKAWPNARLRFKSKVGVLWAANKVGLRWKKKKSESRGGGRLNSQREMKISVPGRKSRQRRERERHVAMWLMIDSNCWNDIYDY